MRLRLLLPLASLLPLAVPTSASAARPTGAAAITDTTHIRVHYDAARTSLADAQALGADAEEAYGKLVGGAGGTPNAGLRVPVSDGTLGGDGRVDYYLVDTYSGGAEAIGDSSAEHASGYVQMDPDLSRGATRFRAAHEFMHLIAWAYSTEGGLHTESTANWAAEWSLPDVDPVDSAFSQPWVPLDCSYGSWETLACSNGYRQWPFVQRQVELYGPAFVDGWLMRVDALNAVTLLTTAQDRQVLGATLQASGGPTATLRQAYADYAWRVWDPTVWTTTALSTMFATREPATTDVTVSRGAPDTGTVGVTVDHLAARYVRIVNAGAEPTGPQDRLRITVGVPSPVAAVPVVLLGDKADWARTRVPLTGSCSGLPCAEVSADPATVRDVVLVLANDQDPGAAGSTTPFDDASFTYRVQLLPGAATPPAGDEYTAPVDVPLGTETVVDAAYAGGRGTDEAPCSGFSDGATRGVWLRFRAPNSGTYLLDENASDLRTVMVVYRAGTRVSCSFRVDAEHGSAFATGLSRGTIVDVYVGRHASSRSRGHTVRLTVTGPAAPEPTPTPTATPTPTPGPGPTPTPTPSPSPPDTTPPTMRLVRSTVRATRSGSLAFVLVCPATESRCRGTLSLPRTRNVRLGSVTFSIAGGRRTTVRIRLSASARRMLRRARRLRATATIAAQDAAGNRRTTRPRVTLLAAR